MNILTFRRFYGFISPRLRPVVEAGGLEANSSCLILRNFACVGYKESEEHIFKTKTSRKPFPLHNCNVDTLVEVRRCLLWELALN